MKRIVVIISLAMMIAFEGCETTSSNVPPVTAAMAGDKSKVRELRAGRELFLSRCIDCHSLPPIARYSASEWPPLVRKMSGRAHLKAEQRDEIVAYILAVKTVND